jgi:hypothetical protein
MFLKAYFPVYRYAPGLTYKYENLAATNILTYSATTPDNDMILFIITDGAAK